MKNICIVRSIDTTYISRIHKSAQALSEQNNYNVTVLSISPRNLYRNKQNIKYTEIKIPIKTRALKSNIFKIIRGLEGYIRIYFILIKIKADIYIAHGLEDLILCYLANAFIGSKIIYNSDELEIGRNYNNSKSKRYLNKIKAIIEKHICKRVDAVIAADIERAKYMEKIHNIEHVYYVRNVPIYTKIVKNNNIRNTLNLNHNTKIVLYQGAMVQGRGLENSIIAISNIKNDIAFVLIGNINKDYKAKLKSLSTRLNFQNLYFIDAISWTNLLEWTSSADISLSLIENSCLSYYLAAPNKLYESIMAGVPYVASNFPEVVRVNNKVKGGILVDPSNTDDITKAIEKLLNDVKFYNICKNNCRINSYNYQWDKEKYFLINIVNNIAKGNKT